MGHHNNYRNKSCRKPVRLNTKAERLTVLHNQKIKITSKLEVLGAGAKLVMTELYTNRTL